MQIKTGFTLVESLFVLSIIVMMFIFSVPYHKDSQPLQKEYIESQIYLTQSNAMVLKEKLPLHYNALTFNEYGNINHASTIDFDTFRCIIQLGMGRFYFD